MTVAQRDNGEDGMFYIVSDNKIAALMKYFWTEDNRIVITHTEVDAEIQGRGAGKLLFSTAISFARSKGIRIVPACAFAREMFDKEVEFRDVL